MIERATKEGADGYLLKEEGIEGLIYLLKNEFMGWALVPARDEFAASPRLRKATREKKQDRD
jgi:hypothetical protein